MFHTHFFYNMECKFGQKLGKLGMLQMVRTGENDLILKTTFLFQLDMFNANKLESWSYQRKTTKV